MLKQKFNFHMHTPRCKHAQPDATDRDFARASLDAGFTSVAFTDHVAHPNPWNPQPEVRMSVDQIDEYLESINRLKKEFQGQMTIQSGFEVEYDPRLDDYYRKLREKCDLFILGQHFMFDQSGAYINPRSQPLSDVDLDLYVERVEEAAKSGMFGVIAHPDVFMLGRSSFGPADEAAARKICQIALAYDLPLEINLCQTYWNMKDGGRIFYPVPEFWAIVSEYPVKVLWGFDIHFLEQAAMAEEVVALSLIHI